MARTINIGDRPARLHQIDLTASLARRVRYQGAPGDGQRSVNQIADATGLSPQRVRRILDAASPEAAVAEERAIRDAAAQHQREVQRARESLRVAEPPTPVETPARRGASVQHAVDFVRRNPGCTGRDYALAAGLTPMAATHRFEAAHKAGLIEPNGRGTRGAPRKWNLAAPAQGAAEPVAPIGGVVAAAGSAASCAGAPEGER